MSECQFCGKENDSKEKDLLCDDCRRIFGHYFLSELQSATTDGGGKMKRKSMTYKIREDLLDAFDRICEDRGLIKSRVVENMIKTYVKANERIMR